MILEFNKPYLYKNKIVIPTLLSGELVVCFDNNKQTILVPLNELKKLQPELQKEIQTVQYIKKENTVKITDPIYPFTPTQPTPLKDTTQDTTQDTAPVQPKPVQPVYTDDDYI